MLTASILSVHQKKHHLKLLIMQLGSFLSSMNVNIVSVLIKETFFKISTMDFIYGLCSLSI